MADERDRPVSKLSGGLHRRLDLAIALVGDPDVLFLDEPTTGFDPAARRAAWRLLEDLKGLGKSILLTTHQLEEANELADRIAILSAGRVVAFGPPSAIHASTASGLAGSVIRFRLPVGAELPMPADLDGGWAVIRTTEPVDTLATLTSWARRCQLELPGLTVLPPSLEDAYLELTSGE